MAKILIVDHDLGCSKAIRTFLESLHHLVAEAGNGIKALRSHQVFVPEIVLLDMLMPEMVGIETLRKLRTLDSELPIVVLSDGGRRNLGPIIQAMPLLGASGVLLKPFGIKDITGILDKLLPRALTPSQPGR
jgi:DNA-binding response OmpR family regulator